MERNVKAYAKLNLSIDVISKMENGYHSMRMVMQTVKFHDEIHIAVQPGEGIKIKTNLRYIPSDDRNIAVKAAKLFFEHTGITGQGVSIDLKKNIPVCAGMGGGSSDAAAVLRALNDMFDTKLDREVLEELSFSLGADVPFCIAGGTALAEGAGEILTDLPSLPPCSIVICKPAISISTPTLFSNIDCNKIQIHPDTEGIIKALEDGSLTEVARRMYNVFETVLPKGADDVAEIKAKLLDFNALGTTMTGTGSAVFGIFDDPDAANAAYQELKSSYRECHLTEAMGRLDV